MMGIWQPTTRTQYRLLALGVALLLGTAGAVATIPSADAQADLTLNSLDVADATTTAEGNVTDVTLSASLDYSHEVPSADRRVVKLKAGPSENDLQLLDYRQARDPSGTASGTVDITSSLFQHDSFTAETFNPEYAGETTQEVVVQAAIEVHQPDGEVVRHTVTDTATVTITDSGEVTATVGGTGTFTVQTDA